MEDYANFARKGLQDNKYLASLIISNRSDFWSKYEETFFLRNSIFQKKYLFTFLDRTHRLQNNPKIA